VPQLSPLEILVVAAVALIVFGPEKLPDIARTVGGAAARMRQMAAEFREEFETSLSVDDDDEFETDDDDDVVPRNRPPARGTHRPQGAPRASRPGSDEDGSGPEAPTPLHDEAPQDASGDVESPPTTTGGAGPGGDPPETTPER
jgi:Tat protein translocase TatB subunit